jgi:hypothetical protein
MTTEETEKYERMRSVLRAIHLYHNKPAVIKAMCERNSCFNYEEELEKSYRNIQKIAHEAILFVDGPKRKRPAKKK